MKEAVRKIDWGLLFLIGTTAIIAWGAATLGSIGRSSDQGDELTKIESAIDSMQSKIDRITGESRNASDPHRAQ